jgi:hypothetical protein
MKINIKTFLLCPIPEDQKPMNDYLKLKEKKGPKNYFFFFAFLFYKCILFFEKQSQLFFSKIEIFFFLALFLYSLFSLQKYLQYFNLKKALSSSRFFYEEGSWYDGAVWEKPFIIIKNDKLLESQKVNFFLRFLLSSLTIDFCIVFIICFFWNS